MGQDVVGLGAAETHQAWWPLVQGADTKQGKRRQNGVVGNTGHHLWLGILPSKAQSPLMSRNPGPEALDIILGGQGQPASSRPPRLQSCPEKRKVVATDFSSQDSNAQKSSWA